MSKLKDQELQLFLDVVRGRIQELERKTSVEFVPVMVERSATYAWVSGLVFVVFFIVTNELLLWLSVDLTSWQRLPMSFSAGALLGLLSNRTSICRWIVSPHEMNEEVEEMAHRVFLKEEVFATKARSGLLLLVSKLERKVFLLADKGLLAVMPGDYWKDLGMRLAADFNAKKPGETFLSALNELAPQLSEKFPPASENLNELSDHVRS